MKVEKIKKIFRKIFWLWSILCGVYIGSLLQFYMDMKNFSETNIEGKNILGILNMDFKAFLNSVYQGSLSNSIGKYMVASGIVIFVACIVILYKFKNKENVENLKA